MMRQTHRAAAILLILPVIAAPNSGIIQVTGVRSWSHPGSTRVIIETSGPAEYRADRAENPERLFFDILHARPWINNRRIATREISDALVRRVRIAETSPGTTRVVFDLNGSAEYKVTKLDTPDRIVIELTPGRTSSGPGQQPVRMSEVQTPRQAALPKPVRASVGPGPKPYRRIYIAPVPPVYVPPVISIPVAPPPLEFGVLAPFQIPDSWTSLENARMPRRPSVQQAKKYADPVAPVNTTTKILPSTRTPVSGTPKASSDATLSLTRALGLKINRIVIDAGHGGHDDGTIGPHGVMEKDVVLDVALRLASLLQTRLGAEVVLTRSDDTFVPLTERTAIANEHKADLFLSIHANSSPAPAVAGTETFLLNFTSSPGAIAVAARENAGSEKSVGELRDLVQSITLNDKIAESQNFAASVQSSIFAQAAKSNPVAHDRGVKKAPFVVLIGAQMPSVLAEIGFLSNSRDESNLGKPDYRQKIAESLYKGVANYSQSLSHFELAGSTNPASNYSGTGAK
jgi:N-acetylmuramoyl-L-alanine amidase